jgi:hypothetical protein
VDISEKNLEATIEAALHPKAPDTLHRMQKPYIKCKVFACETDNDVLGVHFDVSTIVET